LIRLSDSSFRPSLLQPVQLFAFSPCLRILADSEPPSCDSWAPERWGIESWRLVGLFFLIGCLVSPMASFCVMVCGDLFVPFYFLSAGTFWGLAARVVVWSFLAGCVSLHQNRSAEPVSTTLSLLFCSSRGVPFLVRNFFVPA